MLDNKFFDRDAFEVAKDLLGKVLYVRFEDQWLCAQIIETEAYYKSEKGSHASLGYTEKRRALFMDPGTIYMYYARGGDSLNISCKGEGNAVLIKSGVPYCEIKNSEKMISTMQKLNPLNSNIARDPKRLCSGQTLLCKSLNLRVKDWDQKCFSPTHFFIKDHGYRPKKLVNTRRLGIPAGRDEHLFYRLVDYDFTTFCTSNPLSKRKWQLGKDYFIIETNTKDHSNN